MAAWIEASPERRKGKIQAAVDAAADAYLTAADAWRVARDNESNATSCAPPQHSATARRGIRTLTTL